MEFDTREVDSYANACQICIILKEYLRDLTRKETIEDKMRVGKLFWKGSDRQK